MSRRVFITGANGFIGSNLCRYFSRRGFEVFGLVRPSCDLHLLDGLPVKLVVGDLREPASFEIPAGCESIIHSASIVSDMAGEEESRTHIYDLVVNLAGKIRAQAGDRPKRLVYISTALTLGFLAKNISEQRPGHPALFLPYVRFKKESEEYLLREWRQCRLPVVILRPGDVYGPGDRTTCALLLRGIERGIPLIAGSGDHLFGFCYVENLCQAVFLACHAEGIDGKAYTVTNGSPITWRAFFSGLQAGLGRRQRWPVPVPVAFALAGLHTLLGRLLPRFRPSINYYRIKRITSDTTYDISETIAGLGYRPDDDHVAQIRSIVDWYQAEKSAGRGKC